MRGLRWFSDARWTAFTVVGLMMAGCGGMTTSVVADASLDAGDGGKPDVAQRAPIDPCYQFAGADACAEQSACTWVLKCSGPPSGCLSKSAFCWPFGDAAADQCLPGQQCLAFGATDPNRTSCNLSAACLTPSEYPDGAFFFYRPDGGS
jgi:hypothetical protein